MTESAVVRWEELENFEVVVARVTQMARAEPWNEALEYRIAAEVGRAWSDGHRRVLKIWAGEKERAKALEAEAKLKAAPEPKPEKALEAGAEAEAAAWARLRRRKLAPEGAVSSGPEMQSEAAAQPIEIKKILDLDPAPASSLRIPDAPKPPEDATELERLTYPHGLLGHVVQYIVDTAQLPDRRMALAGALSVCAKALDRKVTGPRDNSVVLWTVLLSETGRASNTFSVASERSFERSTWKMFLRLAALPRCNRSKSC
jgi:hypothetical protein